MRLRGGEDNMEDMDVHMKPIPVKLYEFDIPQPSQHVKNILVKTNGYHQTTTRKKHRAGEWGSKKDATQLVSFQEPKVKVRGGHHIERVPTPGGGSLSRNDLIDDGGGENDEDDKSSGDTIVISGQASKTESRNSKNKSLLSRQLSTTSSIDVSEAVSRGLSAEPRNSVTSLDEALSNLVDKLAKDEKASKLQRKESNISIVVEDGGDEGEKTDDEEGEEQKSVQPVDHDHYLAPIPETDSVMSGHNESREDVSNDKYVREKGETKQLFSSVDRQI